MCKTQAGPIGPIISASSGLKRNECSCVHSQSIDFFHILSL